jgi:HEAT repeat protein
MTMLAPEFSAFVGTLTRGESINPERLDLFSSLDPASASHLEHEWRSIPLPRRLELLEMAAEVAYADVSVDFARLARIGWHDTAPEIRRAAVGLLWEASGADDARALLYLLRTDDSPLVRAAVAEVLGNFVLAREFDTIDEAEGDAVVAALRRLASDDAETEEVRATAVLALAPRTLPWVETLITDAYYDQSRTVRLAAVRAMGVAADSMWSEYLEEQLSSDDPDFRAEAVISLGAIGDEAFLEPVATMLDDDDEDVVVAAIGALGEIGGPDAVALLEQFQEHASAEFLDDIEEALEVAREHLNRAPADWSDDDDF